MKKAIIASAVVLIISLICTVCFAAALGRQAFVDLASDDSNIRGWLTNISGIEQSVNGWADYYEDEYDYDSARLLGTDVVEMPQQKQLHVYADCAEVRFLPGTEDKIVASLDQFTKTASAETFFTLSTPDDNTISVRGANPDGPETVRARLTVYVPQNVEALDIQVEAGDIDISGLDLETLKVSLSAGEIDLERVAAKTASLSVAFGNIDVDSKTLVSETLSIQNECGNVDLVLPSTAPFHLSFNIETGDVEMEEQPQNWTIHTIEKNVVGVTGEIAQAATGGETQAKIQVNIHLGNLDLDGDA